MQANPVTGPANVLCRAPYGVYHQLVQHALKASATPTLDSAVASPSTPKRSKLDHCTPNAKPSAVARLTCDTADRSVCVCTASSYGVERQTVYRSEADVAQRILEAMEDAPAQLRATFREFRMGPRYSLLFMPWRQWDSQRAAGA